MVFLVLITVVILETVHILLVYPEFTPFVEIDVEKHFTELDLVLHIVFVFDSHLSRCFAFHEVQLLDSFIVLVGVFCSTRHLRHAS